MSSKSQATKEAAQQAKKIRKAVSENLVNLDDNASGRNNPGELNQKIGKIDADLDDLKKDLSTTNKGLMKNLAQLDEKDLDLRAKVTEAYQQLGELDGAYRSLAGKSAEISREIKAVSKRVNEVNQKSDEQFDSLSGEYQTLVERVEELTTKSKKTTQDLNKSIKANTQAMQDLERNLLTEIDELATTSKRRDEDLEQRTDALTEGLNKADEEIKASQARLIKMQAIDQALEKRAAALEASTTELTNKSRDLARSTTTLHNRTQQISQAITALQETTEMQRQRIEILEVESDKTSLALFSLVVLEKRHFRTLAASLGLLLIAFVGFLFYNQATWEDESSVNAALESGITIVSEDLASTENQVVGLNTNLTQLQHQTQAADQVMQQELSSINLKLATIGDQVDSLDGRLTNLRPHRSFGNGNVIHGPEWLARQPAGQYVIHLATLNDKQALYKLAERYSHYLKDDLAYVPVSNAGAQGFALIYGQFESEGKAAAALSRMPRYIERERPRVYQMGAVQHYLAGGS
jgi:DNA repair exonuclease SbcCD ATPase subunit